jgi:hypothetical protein
MGILKIFTDSTVGKYAKAIRSAPPEMIYNRSLIFSAILYAMAGVPISESRSIQPRSRKSPPKGY